MTLVTTSYWREFWDDFDRTHRLLDDHFSRSLVRNDFFHPVRSPFWYDFFRPWRHIMDGVISDVAKTESDCDKFRIVVDVQPFSPYEIIVKTIGNSIIVKANHEEHRGVGNYTTREFMRRYDLPKGYDITRVMSNLSSDGMLTITAPRLAPPPPNERMIPINRTRYPALKY